MIAPPSRNTYIALARSAAEGRTGIPAAQWEIAHASPRAWSSGALGLPEPGRAYTAALVNGYFVVLKNGDQILRFHCGYAHAKFAGEGLTGADFGRVTPPEADGLAS